MVPEVTPLRYAEYLDLAQGAASVLEEDELVELYQNLLGAGPGLDLFALVAALVAARRTAALRRLQADCTALHQAVGEAPGAGNGEEFGRRFGPPFREDESSAVHALRVLAALGLVLAEDEPHPDLLRAALAWYREAHGAPAGAVAPWSPAAVAGQDELLRRCLQRLAEAAGADKDSLATLTAAATLRRLRQPTVKPRAEILLNEPGPAAGGLVPAGRLWGRIFRLTRRPRWHVIKALLDVGTAGTEARLTISVDRTMPAGLIPDPERMSLFAADETFQNALGRAWRQAGQGRIRGLVTWSATAQDGPVRYVGGESAGAAFAVAIDEARRLARPVRALAVFRRLVSGNAVVGRIDDSGYLQSVEGYETKLGALRENARVIVPAADVERANQAKAAYHGEDKEFEIEVIAAAHWKDAARKARRTSTKVLLSRGIALVLVGALITTGVVALSQHNDATKAARTAASVQLARLVEPLADHADPVTAAGLAAAAWQEAPTSQARESLLTLLAQPLRAVITQGGPFKWVGFSPGRGAVLAAVGTSIRLWNAATDRPLGNPVPVPDGAVSAAFSPDGSVLATADADGTVRLWDLATGRQTGATLTVSASSGVNAVAFSPNGSMLATADGDGTARLWDLSTGRQTGAALPAGDAAASGGQVKDVAFSPDGAKLATASLDGTARLWDVATRRQIGAAMTDGNPVSDLREMQHVAFSPDGATLATVSADDTVRLWSVSSQRETGRAGVPGEVPTDIAFGQAFGFAGAMLVIADSDGTADLWDAVTSHEITALPAEAAGNMLSVAASPDGAAVATVGQDGTADVWDVYLFHAIGPTVESGSFTAETLGPDGRTLATAELNRTIGLWNLATGRLAGPPIRVGDVGVAALAFSPNGRFLAAAGDDGNVQVWNLATGRLAGPPIRVGDVAVAALAFSPNGRFLAAGDDDGSVQVWNLATRRPLGLSFTVTDEVHALVFSPDGTKIAAVTSQGSAGFWDVGTNRPATGLPAFKGGVQALAFSPDGTMLATADYNGEARLWNLATDREIDEPLVASLLYKVEGVAFSPDGTMLATANSDGDIRLFDVATGGEIGPAMVAASPVSGVQSVAFSADGTTLAAFGPGEAATVWDVALPADLFNVACSIVNGPLTQRVWNSYAPAIPYIRVCQ